MYCDLYLLQESGQVGQNSAHCVKLKDSSRYICGQLCNSYYCFFLQSNTYMIVYIDQFKYVNRCSAIVLNE